MLSAMATIEAHGLPRGRSLTRDDLDAMPDDGHRYELVDGVLVVSPAPRHNHQRAAAQLFRALDRVVPEQWELFFAPFDVVLSGDTVLQPDLLVADRDAFTERDLPGPPLLAVEVLSPSTRSFDLLLKKERLERAGCAHYWVVDPDEPSILAWSLTEGVYHEVARAAGAESFVVTAPLPVTIVPADLVR
ncbi:Uma2 family endonuclease [Aeromicrobium piscarium]|uniref:Uma2 family endonuclease n=2 Tax=Aeromicrobium piscarium TaxID=2590901 RepID=A0A554RWB8_9ACTN|nr:Uma2 family endonuclease [Aeromicrobium piscarium]